ncbi:MAG: hypothetical protein ACLQDY_24465 [Streptosporangiaceae bacterium]
MDETLEICQASRYRHAHSQLAALEGKKADDLGTLGQHGHPGPGAKTADRDGKLRTEERAGQVILLTLHAMPERNFVGAQLAGPHY